MWWYIISEARLSKTLASSWLMALLPGFPHFLNVSWITRSGKSQLTWHRGTEAVLQIGPHGGKLRPLATHKPEDWYLPPVKWVSHFRSMSSSFREAFRRSQHLVCNLIREWYQIHLVKLLSLGNHEIIFCSLKLQYITNIHFSLTFFCCHIKIVIFKVPCWMRFS